MSRIRIRIFASQLVDLANGSKQLADLDARLAQRYRRNALGLFAACAVGLVPWTIFLAFTLSPNYHAHHWRLVWSGFDALLFVALASTAYLGWRRRQAVIGAAIVTATLLVCDAWFDITLDLGTSGVWASVASAVFVELPLAVFLLWRVYLLMQLSARLIYPALGYSDAPHAVRKMPIFALDVDESTKHNHTS